MTCIIKALLLSVSQSEYFLYQENSPMHFKRKHIIFEIDQWSRYLEKSDLSPFYVNFINKENMKVNIIISINHVKFKRNKINTKCSFRYSNIRLDCKKRFKQCLKWVCVLSQKDSVTYMALPSINNCLPACLPAFESILTADDCLD